MPCVIVAQKSIFYVLSVEKRDLFYHYYSDFFFLSVTSFMSCFYKAMIFSPLYSKYKPSFVTTENYGFVVFSPS